MYTRKLYQELSSLLQARENCASSYNQKWFEHHTEAIRDLCSGCLPHGAGIDGNCDLDMEASRPERLVFQFEYHHMNDSGYYTHWTNWTVTVTPSLSSGFDLTIRSERHARNVEGLKEYFSDLWHEALNTEIDIQTRRPVR